MSIVTAKTTPQSAPAASHAGGGEEVHDGVQQRLHALAAQRRAREHRAERPRPARARERRADLRPGGRLALEVASEQIVVRLTHGLQQHLLLPEGRRRRREHLPDLPQNAVPVRAHAVDLVEEEHDRDVRLAQRRVEQLRLRLHALHRGEDEHRAVQRPRGCASTSLEKSAWPGVSTSAISTPFHAQQAEAALTEMPRVRSTESVSVCAVPASTLPWLWIPPQR